MRAWELGSGLVLAILKHYSGVLVVGMENSIKSFVTHKHTTPNQVSTINLDDYLKNLGVLEKISFMKIDVDGPELLVLLSSQSLLKNNNLKILIEWDQKNSKISGCDPASIIDLFIDNNFKIFYPNHEKNKFFQVSKNELLKMEGDVNILCVKNSSILENKGLL